MLTLSANVLLSALGLLTGSLSARLLGPDGRGELAAIQIWPLTIASLGALGLPQALVYFVGKRHGHELRLVQTMWLIMAPLSILWMGLGYAAMPWLLRAQPVKVLESARVFLVMIPILFLESAHTAIQGFGDFLWWNIFRLNKPVAYLALIAALTLMGVRDAASLAYLFILISLIGPLIVLALLGRVGPLFPYRPDPALIRPMLSFGLQTVAGSLPQMLNTRMDQLLMVAFLSPEQLGLYVAAVSWSGITGPLVGALRDVTMPRVAAAETTMTAHLRACLSLRLGAAVSVPTGLLFTCLAPLGVRVLFGPPFVLAVQAAMVLTIAGIFWNLNQLASAVLKGLGIPAPIAMAEGAGLVITGVLLWGLLPRYGIVGAAIASLIAYIIVFILLMNGLSSHTHISVGALMFPQAEDWRRIWEAWRRLGQRAVPSDIHCGEHRPGSL